MKKVRRVCLAFTLLSFIGPVLVALSGTIKFNEDWRTADRSSSGIAPLAHEETDAIVQVYSARAFNWRGLFGIHTWIAMKEKNADKYMVHQVLGWRSWNDLPVLVSEQDTPDRRWYGYDPEVLVDIRGLKAEKAIKDINVAIVNYKYQRSYTMWPGPNSNSFIAEIGRRVAALKLDLPATAIGKDFLVQGKFFDKTPSASGYQFSLYGLFGVGLGKIEGLEFNFLGLSFGINPGRFTLKLPGLGKISL